MPSVVIKDFFLDNTDWGGAAPPPATGYNWVSPRMYLRVLIPFLGVIKWFLVVKFLH